MKCYPTYVRHLPTGRCYNQYQDPPVPPQSRTYLNLFPWSVNPSLVQRSARRYTCSNYRTSETPTPETVLFHRKASPPLFIASPHWTPPSCWYVMRKPVWSRQHATLARARIFPIHHLQCPDGSHLHRSFPGGGGGTTLILLWRVDLYRVVLFFSAWRWYFLQINVYCLFRVPADFKE